MGNGFSRIQIRNCSSEWKKHQNADTLSRNPLKRSDQSVDEDLGLLVLLTTSHDFRHVQEHDPRVMAIFQDISSNEQSKPVPKYCIFESLLYRKIMVSCSDFRLYQIIYEKLYIKFVTMTGCPAISVFGKHGSGCAATITGLA